MPCASVFIGNVWHKRLSPVEHEFRYPLFMFGCDLASLWQDAKQTLGFATDRFSLLSLYSSEYLVQGAGSLEERVRAYIGSALPDLEYERMVLFTTPRLLGYVFNPVT